MRVSKSLKAVAVLLAASTTGALASPLILGPTVAPITAPKVGVQVLSVNIAPVQKQALQTYRQVRAFWLSRGVVR